MHSPQMRHCYIIELVWKVLSFCANVWIDDFSISSVGRLFQRQQQMLVCCWNGDLTWALHVLRVPDVTAATSVIYFCSKVQHHFRYCPGNRPLKWPCVFLVAVAERVLWICSECCFVSDAESLMQLMKDTDVACQLLSLIDHMLQKPNVKQVCASLRYLLIFFF